ncbi:gluconokinase [Nocardioides sp. JQ2195]|uniref:gluconokinase n=1 Tax=Nocardioides sp. JQ2195 TaxID=2592334 RepID=UPI00143ECFEC|nr:gluconokinase [Nocardioides sp. JQ2195]QIX27909.1 gluconokinase [Nocardioides sp. JQ2195]
MSSSESSKQPGPLLVAMGVSGSGKTAVGSALARRLRVPFVDGDDLHPQANVEKMSRGEALDDDDRRPWLDAVGAWLSAHETGGGVVACSALKRRYRDQLRQHSDRVEFVHLHGDRDLIAARQADRSGHFMPSSLLTSQLRTLEQLAPDEAGLVIDVDQGIDDIVQEYVDRTGAE